MATSIYETEIIRLIDGTKVEISPLKIKYLRNFMKEFDLVRSSKGDDETLEILSECVSIAMQQYYPQIKNKEDVEDNLDLKTLYKVIEVSSGIKMQSQNESVESPESLIQSKSESSWETFDLAKLESEVFLLGVWKDYNHLELSLSIPELMATLEAKREQDYADKKFTAAMQGVDLDEQVGKKEDDAWEKLKARVASGGATDDANDILGFQGIRAAQAGFGIGMGLDYEVIDDTGN